jgi:hypothetical protein
MKSEISSSQLAVGNIMSDSRVHHIPRKKHVYQCMVSILYLRNEQSENFRFSFRMRKIKNYTWQIKYANRRILKKIRNHN